MIKINKLLKIESYFFYIFVYSYIFMILLSSFCFLTEEIIPDISSLKYIEYSKEDEIFVYEFESVDTYDLLDEIVIKYNKEFGYDTENKILVGKGKKEFVFAEYNENSITIFCENTSNCRMTNKQIQTYLTVLFDLFKDVDIDFNFMDYLSYNSDMASIIFPIIFKSYMYDLYIPSYILGSKILTNFIDILNSILIIIAYIYLIYIIIYFIYSKIKKNKIINVKKKVILFILLILYLYMDGLYGIFEYVTNFLELFMYLIFW